MNDTQYFCDLPFILCPPGTFQMGTPENPNEILHEVELTKKFHIMQTTVTQKQWYEVMGSASWQQSREFEECKKCSVGPELPVCFVSWSDIQKFLAKLNNGLSKPLFFLPTEAQWEYAARAGTQHIYYHSYTPTYLGDYAWLNTNSGNKLNPVGKREANNWGIHDMLGNVWEWTNDNYNKIYYQHSPKTDPTGPKRGAAKVFRGGSFTNSARYLKIAYRNFSNPTARGKNLGFRIIRLAE